MLDSRVSYTKNIDNTSLVFFNRDHNSTFNFHHIFSHFYFFHLLYFFYLLWKNWIGGISTNVKMGESRLRSVLLFWRPTDQFSSHVNLKWIPSTGCCMQNVFRLLQVKNRDRTNNIPSTKPSSHKFVKVMADVAIIAVCVSFSSFPRCSAQYLHFKNGWRFWDSKTC